jgi:hypothetical protein
MQRLTWAPMGAGGTVLHAIAVVHSGDEGATSLCGYEATLRTPEEGMKPCANCQETLKALVDTMPSNATV